MKKLYSLVGSKASMLVAVTLFAGALFKLSAFARESFIASRFGLTSVTDAYFGLQQLPLTLATFFFGAFSLAFTPAYAEARKSGGPVAWLPGLLTYSAIGGGLLTAATIFFAFPILHSFVRAPGRDTWLTLVILSAAYLPIIFTGIQAAICVAHGKNLTAMTVTGLPYLLMTITLVLMYAAGKLGNLSLPISMASGFGLVGIFSLITIAWQEKPAFAVKSMLMPWRTDGFQRFTSRLSASSTENLGNAANQMLMLHFLAFAGTGAISANNCATRIGMLGYSILVQPLTQLFQAQLCTLDSNRRLGSFRNYLAAMAGGSLLLALTLCAFRFQVVQLIYMRGKFTATELSEVASMLPAWLAYFVVMSLNAVVARFLYTQAQGAYYMRCLLCGYAAANVLRFCTVGHFSPPWIIWWSVLGEGCAFLANLRCALGNGDHASLSKHFIPREETGLRIAKTENRESFPIVSGPV